MDFREVKEFFKDIGSYIITFLIIILFFTFIISLQSISGNSMHPTLKEGNIVIVNKLFYRLGKVHRNDIVEVKNDEGKTFVKRVIGLPGEKIEYLNGILYVGGTAYKETYLNDDVITNNFLFEDICSIDDCPDGVIPKDKYLLLGDNRQESEDSRTSEFGLRSRKNIKGKVTIKLWPLKEIALVG